jgi:EAL domain-containing protein (putative c-di-GMP-specific phosphodiesterase class I)
VTHSPRDGDDSDQLIEHLLTVVRRHLQMDVAFVGRVADGRRTFDFVDTDPWFSPVQPGDGDDVADSYCGRVLSGRIPSLIPDARREPGVADLSATWQLPVGAHLSVPILTPDGRTYGTLCCFSRLPNPDLSARDVQVLRIFAEVVGSHLEPLAVRQAAQSVAHDAVTEVLDAGGPRMALQPIVRLGNGGIVGYEALARFPATFDGPESWFRAAAAAGLNTALESAAVHAALRLLPRIPDPASLTVNVSASALLDSTSIVAMFTGPRAPRLVLEVTEHQRIEDPEALDAKLTRIREAGARVAVDDAGSGYAGLERILALRPEVLKLDRALVHSVAEHPGRQAMCQAMVGFTRRVGADLVAEGVETTDDLLMLRALGVSHAQGYLLGRPRIPGERENIENLHTGWISSEAQARRLLTGELTDPSAETAEQMASSLEDTVKFAERCRQLVGEDADRDATTMVQAAVRLHRRSATSVMQ